MIKLFLLGLLAGFVRGMIIWLSERMWNDRTPLQGA